MMNVKISLARPTDALAIAEMSRRFIEAGLPWSWTEPRVARCVRHADCAVLLARDGRRLAGFAIMEFLEEHAHLSLLAVHPGYRLRGVGTALVQWLEASARAAGIFSIRLELRAENQGALSFYQRLGYQDAGRHAAYYNGVEDARRMTRNLSVVQA